MTTDLHMFLTARHGAHKAATATLGKVLEQQGRLRHLMSQSTEKLGMAATHEDHAEVCQQVQQK